MIFTKDWRLINQWQQFACWIRWGPKYQLGTNTLQLQLYSATYIWVTVCRRISIETECQDNAIGADCPTGWLDTHCCYFTNSCCIRDVAASGRRWAIELISQNQALRHSLSGFLIFLSCAWHWNPTTSTQVALALALAAIWKSESQTHCQFLLYCTVDKNCTAAVQYCSVLNYSN